MKKMVAIIPLCGFSLATSVQVKAAVQQQTMQKHNQKKTHKKKMKKDSLRHDTAAVYSEQSVLIS